MAALLGQDRYIIYNLSQLSKDECIKPIGISTSCSNFSIMGINDKGEYIALIGHAFTGKVDDAQLKNFENEIKKHNLKYLSILDISMEDYKDTRATESKKLDNVINWVNRLYDSNIIEGCLISQQYSYNPNEVIFRSDGIYTKNIFQPKPINGLEEIQIGNNNPSYFNELKQIRIIPVKKSPTQPPQLSNSTVNQEKSPEISCNIL